MNISQKVILLVTGSIASGKDTFSKSLKNWQFCKLSIANSLKDQVSKENDIPISELYFRETKEVHRQLIRNTAMETKFKHGEDFYINKTINIMKNLKRNRYVISDFRYPNEFHACRKMFPEYIVLPIRIERFKSGADDSNLKEFPIPFVIKNNGNRQELEDSVETFVEKVLFNNIN